MRATHRSDRVRIWPKLAVASALTLLASSMVAGVVFAATPTVAWGTFTPDTSRPGRTRSRVGGSIASFTVSLRNDDASTISQLYLKAVTQAAQPAPESQACTRRTTRSTCAQAVSEADDTELLFPQCEAGRTSSRSSRLYRAAGAAATCLRGRAKRTSVLR
jgi:hypothetical protein